MFHVLEDARMSIGAKSAATMSTGYLNALEYAKERIQGPDLTQTRDPNAPRVAIIKHPDVRRMLIQQKAYSEGMRALTLYSAWVLDQVMLHPEEPYWSKLSDLLLPLVKGYCSEKSYDLMGQCLQVFGGSGLHQGLPAGAVRPGPEDRQPLRGHHRHPGHGPVLPQDRPRPGARPSCAWPPGIMETVKARPAATTPSPRSGTLLGKAMEDVQGQLMAMLGYAMGAMQDPTQLYKVGLHTNAMLESLAEAVMGWLLLRHAEIAHAALPGSGAARTRPSTRARSPRLAGSPPTCCLGPPCGAPWPRRSRARSWPSSDEAF